VSLAAKIESEGRWRRTLESPDGLAENLGDLGISVGPRNGPTKRTHGEKEDYVLRRLLVAWKKKEILRFPVDIQAASEATAPDFVLYWPDGETRGVEVTEAGKEDYQAWMTTVESKIGSGKTVSLPFDESIKGTAAEILDVIRKKVGKAKKGQYRDPEDCDLLVYDNTAWGGFLDGRELLDALGRPKDLVGPFRQIHLVEGAKVHLDIFGQRQSVDISKEYETDYAGWITEQAERLRDGATDKLDLAHLAEEFGDLGRAEHRALASYFRNLMVHLLKWRYQPDRRSGSWSASINNSRSQIHDLLTESPSLRLDLTVQVPKQYARARQIAADETGMPLNTFPEQCPYEHKQLVDPEFLPEHGDGRRSDWHE